MKPLFLYWKDRWLGISMWCCLVLATSVTATGQPQPGDVYREYWWTNQGGDAGGSLRVGGRLDYGGKPIRWPQAVDLGHATRAEIVFEKLLCHDGTRGLSISVNDHPWIEAPEAEGIPEPQWAYQHHTYPVVRLPLKHLNSGADNGFRLRVHDEHSWGWPQNLIYGVHLRVFYDAARKDHSTGRLVVPAAGNRLGTVVPLEVQVTRPEDRVASVDFLGCFENVNLEGDGRYTQWHYHYVQAKFTGHIGSVTREPWQLQWDTQWIPDQSEPFRLGARITDATGLTYFTESVDGLTFDRGELSVELCKPYEVPKKWVTRSGERAEKFRIRGNLAQATAAHLVWCSWSPGYMEGIYINDQQVFEREGPRYAYFVHNVPVDDLSVFKPGENVLKTGKTPKYNGKMVHGMEVNWPGVMVLIQYVKSERVEE